MIADDTPLVPQALAETVAGRFRELDGRALKPLADHLVYRAEVAYSHSPEMREKIANPSMRYSRARSFLLAMMRGWAEAYIEEHHPTPADPAAAGLPGDSHAS